MIKKFRLWENIIGWVVFAMAAFTYLMTIEPTMSLWDCSEFIASAYKLEVGHPPGAPFFMLLGRFFTFFAGGDTSRAAMMVNAMSGLASAFTILFLFWTITHLARRIFLKQESDYTAGRIIAVLGAGVTGAMAYAFSDTFWFSAVEGEVYATSSLFTAVVFWAMLRWEDVADEPYSDRWIILIAFLMGLSIGVHLLNLLAIPAIVFVWYFRKYPFSWKGFAVSTGVSVLLIVLIMYGIIPGIVRVTSSFELFFINSLGMPFNSGMYIHLLLFLATLVLSVWYSFTHSDGLRIFIFAMAALLLSGVWLLTDTLVVNLVFLAAIVWGAWFLSTRHRRALNTVLTALLVIVIGYSSFAVILIRSTANPPMNENNPSNPFALLYYLNREQYGQRPLFHGPYYNAPVTDYVKGKPTYNPSDGRYIITNRETIRKYDERFMTIFPRMWSDSPDHIREYETYVGTKGKPVRITDPQTGEPTTLRVPTFGQNLSFMFRHQLGFMYFRYFMWNFSGRQNDVQSTGGPVNGNWITGIEFLDAPRTGSVKGMPDDMRNDPSRNRYYLLPLLLGLVGFLWHFNRDVRNWWIVLLLFVMTGIAIVIYLNQYPNQPRERDYAYAASFYAFTIWIGLGVLALFELLRKATGETPAAVIASVLTFAAVPALMGSENWDDHDRSGRYLGRDVAFNYLNSVAPNAIIFTGGDNDTFPLWYAQEVEGVRTDVRVANLMLLNTDWYIDQMKFKAYTSEPLPISLPRELYYDGVNNQVAVFERVKEPATAREVMKFITSGSDVSKLKLYGEDLWYIPTRTIRIPVDSAKVIANGTVRPEDADKIVPYIDINLKGSWIMKNQLLVLDILAHNDWDRPVYFVAGQTDDALGLEEYFQLEGLAYRLVPVRGVNRGWFDYGRINTDILYENLMNRFTWTGSSDPDVYLDFYHKRTLMVVRARLNYARLAVALAEEGDTIRAREVINRSLELFPVSKMGYNFYFSDIIAACFAAGDRGKATELSKGFADYYYERTAYMLDQRPSFAMYAGAEIANGLQMMLQAMRVCFDNGETTLAGEINGRYNELYERYAAMNQ
ncbi:MAG: DUF2723 domain-containing protein [Bacteroidales bacterium]|jgi:hypothetical protein|nr:DUF2723 domain-containing protein [Bacteroidales bacterium]